MRCRHWCLCFSWFFILFWSSFAFRRFISRSILQFNYSYQHRPNKFTGIFSKPAIIINCGTNQNSTKENSTTVFSFFLNLDWFGRTENCGTTVATMFYFQSLFCVLFKFYLVLFGQCFFFFWIKTTILCIFPEMYFSNHRVFRALFLFSVLQKVDLWLKYNAESIYFRLLLFLLLLLLLLLFCNCFYSEW